MRTTLKIAALAAGMAFTATNAIAQEVRAIPPNMIGLVLTPTGFDGQIHKSGQVNIGKVGWFANWANKLILIQKSGFAIKEKFAQKGGPDDGEDHRCIVGPRREPMSLDVRLLFALPDPDRPEGKEAIIRMGLLGNPTLVNDANLYGGDRVMVLDARTVYHQQVQVQVRGKIREACIKYESVDAVFEAVKTGAFSTDLKKQVAVALVDNSTPLQLVDAVASNVKPDPKVMDGIAFQLAMEKKAAGIEQLARSLAGDQAGTRQMIYRLLQLEEIVKQGGAKGNNTIFLSDLPGGVSVVPVPAQR